jgi:signal peptidase
MPSLQLGECDGSSLRLTQSLELTVRSRRRSRRWMLNAAGGVLAFLVLAFVLPPAFGLSHHTVTDDAMSGTMGRGSVVFAKSLPVADLEIGDVIIYRHPKSGELITRRIAAIDAGMTWTRSDSTGALDPWTLTLDQATQARAVADIPYAGYAYDAVASGARLLRWTVSWLR